MVDIKELSNIDLYEMMYKGRALTVKVEDYEDFTVMGALSNIRPMDGLKVNLYRCDGGQINGAFILYDYFDPDDKFLFITNCIIPFDGVRFDDIIDPRLKRPEI